MFHAQVTIEALIPLIPSFSSSFLMKALTESEFYTLPPSIYPLVRIILLNPIILEKSIILTFDVDTGSSTPTGLTN